MGSKAILERLAKNPSAQSNARLGFLLKIFHYFDVMIALSLRKAPLGSPYNQEQSFDVDPIFGLTAGLWPTLHFVARFLANKAELITDEATSLKALELTEQLSTPFGISSTEQEKLYGQPRVDLEALVQISNAYRSSVLLILHHEVLDTRDSEILNRIYSQALDSLLRIAALDGPMATYSTSVWPLFTVGRYANSSSDRTILRHIFLKIYRRHHMKIVETVNISMNQMWEAGVDPNVSTPAPVFFA
jgi:hypothetical protein